MATFLFDKIVFGPVKSRRLGVSLGINLLPCNRKICSFNCIYCECGWTLHPVPGGSSFPARTDVYHALSSRLLEMKEKGESADVITFAGNGEPTLHPDFPLIIDDTIELRNSLAPSAKIAVLSNSSTINNPSIKAALLKVDMNILKLDSAIDETIRIHNQPRAKISVEELIENLSSFEGHVIIQTLFLRGRYNGRVIDNTTPEEIDAWLKAIARIKPEEVMIYTIARDTPEGGMLMKVPAKELYRIAAMVEKLGIKTQVSE
ncbi:MAG TPA: radical SAM protein [Bacteroidales bacterium]|nr:radical SAM protein [Bacteroidales bacterium]HOK73595.1 radical SAM protein [Bacteroidales bacterium]HQG55497.1 radical SAM protein [Bacteroidales bacterium]HRR16403.1 radical SAM protein [Bacteroidales bacterium]HRT47802.1 radical SAM protein [Bacteroidales bacterium]